MRVMLTCFLLLVAGCATPSTAIEVIRVYDCPGAVTTYLEAGCTVAYAEREARCLSCEPEFFLACPEKISERVKERFDPPESIKSYGFSGSCDPYTTWELVK